MTIVRREGPWLKHRARKTPRSRFAKLALAARTISLDYKLGFLFPCLTGISRGRGSVLIGVFDLGMDQYGPGFRTLQNLRMSGHHYLSSSEFDVSVAH